ncbi:hypothetical protein [Actinomadura formosensis]|uniref:hypothetical protein n=1 Tax=Actinomadura formosensis TaxID=60706 RepID=UPI003D917582
MNDDRAGDDRAGHGGAGRRGGDAAQHDRQVAFVGQREAGRLVGAAPMTQDEWERDRGDARADEQRGTHDAPVPAGQRPGEQPRGQHHRDQDAVVHEHRPREPCGPRGDGNVHDDPAQPQRDEHQARRVRHDPGLHQTTTRCTHLVCMTPGRFGAIRRQG